MPRRLRGCECGWMRIRLRPLNVGKLAVRMPNQTHTQFWPGNDTCLKVKFNLIKISAQTKTRRGSLCSTTPSSTCVKMIYRTHAERGKYNRSRSRGQEQEQARSVAEYAK